MEKIWLKEYPKGVPAEINPNEYASLKAVFEDSCRRYSSLSAYTNMGATFSYADLERMSRHFGAWLQKDAGLKQGDRVAIMMPNLLQYPVVLFGILRCGMAAVNVNPLYTARELEHQLKDSGARSHRDPGEFRQHPARSSAASGCETRGHHPDRRSAANARNAYW